MRKRSRFPFFGRKINNSRFTAYNNDVEKITVTERGENAPYMSYLYGKVTDKFSFLPTTSEKLKEGDRTALVFKAERKYCPYIRKYTEENVADVIAIGYKYRYFKDLLVLPLLNGEEKDVLLCALVAADYAEDHAYVREKLKGHGQYCIDGTFHFQLSELKERWKKIADYVPTEFGGASLESFIDFLAGEGENRIFLKDGEAYDEEYRKQSKSELIGKPSLIREILLSGAGNIYCFGSQEKKTEEFLKKYYKEKVVFC